MGCVQSRERGACTSRYPRFILLESFGDTLLVVSIFQSLLVLFNLQLTLSRLWGSLYAVSKVESLAHALASPSDIYPAGKLLDMLLVFFHDYHL